VIVTSYSLCLWYISHNPTKYRMVV